MDREGLSRTQRGSRRDSAVTARLVRTLPAATAVSSTNSWFVQNWGLVVTAAATLVTLALSLGAPNTYKPASLGNSAAAHVGHQSLFASPKSRGGVSIVQRSKARVLQEDVVTTPIVQYETKLQLFMCNPNLAEVGNDAHLVDETRLASALSNIVGLRQVRVNGEYVKCL